MKRAKTSGNIEKQSMVSLIENELTTKDVLEFCPDRQSTNYKFAPTHVTDFCTTDNFSHTF
ncbi:MAG: hypothetical protein AB7S72_09540 [Draconibacterium sp.]